MPGGLSRRDEPAHCHRHRGADDDAGPTLPLAGCLRFQKQDGWVVLDQLRTVDKVRLVRRLGRLSAPAQQRVLATLAEMFAE